MSKEIISTPNAPAAIGTYSQAVKVDHTVYVSGQIPFDPSSMTLISEDFTEQTTQVFKNLAAIAKAAGGTLQDFVKFNVFLTDLSHFPIVNEVMAQFVQTPFPARAAVEVSALPKNVQVEIEGVMVMQ